MFRANCPATAAIVSRFRCSGSHSHYASCGQIGRHILLLFLLIGLKIVDVSSHTPHCKHIHPKAHEVVHGAQIEPHHSIRKRSTEQPLRIILHYDESFKNLKEDKMKLINETILPKAVEFWQQALMVKGTGNVIRLNRKCDSAQVYVKDKTTYCIESCKPVTMCGEVAVPEEHLDYCRVCNAIGTNCVVDTSSKRGPGIENADFIFYVSARQTERCHKGLTVAYAAHCQQESKLDRPIAGHANLCPDSISTKEQELDTLLSTVKHEILHALGFSVSLYAFFRDENEKPRTERIAETNKPPLDESAQIHKWDNTTIRKIVRTWQVRNGSVQREFDIMVTPRVVEEAQKHFNCKTLEGVELEDQGEEGTALTHWEKRILENEAMTGTHTQSPVFSRITLALLEDSGWYKPNYSMAAPLSWGRNLGCDFVEKSCKEWIQKYSEKNPRKIHPFCEKVKRDPLQTECTEDRRSVALCNLVRHEVELPKQYQNFDHISHVSDWETGFYGGSVSLADYCPYIQEFTWRSKNVVVRGSHCEFESNNPSKEKNFALESYGKGSRCFDHTEQMWEERSCQQTREWQHWGSGCYKYKCENGQLHLIVANHTYSCFYPGQVNHIQLLENGWLHKGAIVCPSCKELCENCTSRGEPNAIVYKDELACGTPHIAGDPYIMSISQLIVLGLLGFR